LRLLITSSRMPFALDAIRNLGERGHEVFACDSYAAYLAKLTGEAQP
jgi:hypothetical protein